MRSAQNCLWVVSRAVCFDIRFLKTIQPQGSYKTRGVDPGPHWGPSAAPPASAFLFLSATGISESEAWFASFKLQSLTWKVFCVFFTLGKC